MASYPTTTLLPLSTPIVTLETLSPTLLDEVPTSLFTRSPEATEASTAGNTDVLERGVAIGVSVLALVFIIMLLSWLVSKVLKARKEAVKQDENGADIEMGDGTGATGVERVDGLVDVNLASPQPAHVDDDVGKEDGRVKGFFKG